MKMYYIVNARLPNKKAYSVQIAKMCEAFIEAGVDLALVIPRTRASRTPLKEFHDLRVEVPTVVLPGIDWYGSGKLPFLLSSLVFMIMSAAFLIWKRVRGERAVVYTIDMDSFSYARLPLWGFPVFAEMHTGKSNTFENRYFFRRVAGIIATNTHNDPRESGMDLPALSLIVEPNGVDLAHYATVPSQQEARDRLKLPHDRKIALYLGRLLDWKGLGILTDVAREIPDTTIYVVGGTKEEWEKTIGTTVPENLVIAGECASTEVPLWLAAADTLLILGTQKYEESFKHTTPMKVYEYMAARRPVVAAATPALKSVIKEGEVTWYEPDDVRSLVESIRSATQSVDSVTLDRAHAAAKEHSWVARANRILAFIHTRGA
jgi:glycosyltransferase involved in cell wall biosynthesis